MVPPLRLRQKGKAPGRTKRKPGAFHSPLKSSLMPPTLPKRLVAS